MSDCVDQNDPWSAVRPPDIEPVPVRYRGVWTRTLLETPELRDDTSFVRWMQLGRWHADLRIPLAATTGRMALPLAQLSSGQRALLDKQQGFCGVTQVDVKENGEICQWHRLVDYQPAGPSPDAGAMLFETPDRVIETGVYGVYREVWQRLPDSTNPLIALAEPRRMDGQCPARLFQAGQYLMRVRPLLQPGPEFEISFGTVQAQDAFNWQIQRSTLPELEGRRVPFGVSRQNATTALVELDGRREAWSILEWSEQT